MADRRNTYETRTTQGTHTMRTAAHHHINTNAHAVLALNIVIADITWPQWESNPLQRVCHIPAGNPGDRYLHEQDKLIPVTQYDGVVSDPESS